MPTLFQSLRFTVAIATVMAGAPCTAGAQADPASHGLIENFALTCLAGAAENLKNVEDSAMAAGWSQQAARVVSTVTGARLEGIARPKFLRKGELILVLKPQGRGRHTCSISTALDKPLTTRALASLLSNHLRAGDPIFLGEGRNERAFLRTEGGVEVEARVTRSNSLRFAELMVDSAFNELALLD